MPESNAAPDLASPRIDDLRKVFVVGCAKSGTTWLMNVLNGHDEIVLSGEGRAFWQLAPSFAAAIRNFNQGLSPASARVAAIRDDDFAAIMRTVIDRQLRRYVLSSPPKPRLCVVGDKTPMHTLAIPQIHQLYPDAQFIHIVRDPRDATISQWIFWARDNEKRSFEEFVHYSITHVWPLNVTAALEGVATARPRYAEVRYEDLHARPEVETRRLLELLDVDASDAAVAQCIDAGSFVRQSGGRQRGEEPMERSLYRSGTVGDWRAHIPPDLARQCCAEIADLMRRYGYDPVDAAGTTADQPLPVGSAAP